MMKDEHDGATMELPGMLVKSPEEVVKELKALWMQTIEGRGGCCPVCGQFGKIYKTRLRATLVLGLKWMADHAGKDGWVNVQSSGPRWMLRGKTYSLLTHWGFVESGGAKSGHWRVTPLGRDFINGQVLAPEAVYIYDNKLMAVSEKTVTLRQSLEIQFDFDELMSAQFKWENLAKVEKTNAKGL